VSKNLMMRSIIFTNLSLILRSTVVIEKRGRCLSVCTELERNENVHWAICFMSSKTMTVATGHPNCSRNGHVWRIFGLGGFFRTSVWHHTYTEMVSWLRESFNFHWQIFGYRCGCHLGGVVGVRLNCATFENWSLSLRIRLWLWFFLVTISH